VIPAYNPGPFIGEAVASVLAQTFADFDLVVVDDGSTDDTRSILASFTDERVSYLFQDNRERSGARNTGIRAARGEYIAFLDADDTWLPEKLARQVALLDAHSEIGLVYCSAWKLRAGVIMGEQKATYRGNVVRPLLIVDNVIAGSASAVMVRRDVLDEVGGFDERRIIYEDWDLWLRIARRFPVDFVADNLVHIRVHPASTQMRTELMKSGIRTFFDPLLTDPLWADEVRPVARRVHGLENFLIGRVCCNAGQMAEARRHLLRSVSYDPLRVRAWAYLGVACLGPRPLAWLRAARTRAAQLTRRWPSEVRG
jgi:glycosyltransferase involved in cell wall biosynthesis